VDILRRIDEIANVPARGADDNGDTVAKEP
jgi:hypothetical protein